MSDTVEINIKGLERLIKSLSGELPKARVGILGGKNARNGKGTNAVIGAAHEFGTSVLPVRSFLRMPISEHLHSYMEKSGALDKNVLAVVIKEADITPWLSKIALIAETIVLDAFDSGGFGKWQTSDMSRKKLKQTLVETQQLRNSITSEVE